MAADLVLSYRSVALYPEDISTLEDRSWFNDNVIAFWLEVLDGEVEAVARDCHVTVHPTGFGSSQYKMNAVRRSIRL